MALHAAAARKSRLAALLGLPLVAVVGACSGYFVLRDQPLVWRMSNLAFTAGILTTAVVEEIIPESHDKGEARTAVPFFIGGWSG